MLEAYVLNTSFDIVAVIDAYESFIWTERYFECGDFELYLPLRQELVVSLKRDNYLQLRDSETIMVIEDVEIDTDVEKGTYVTVKGRSLESIIDRRIVWEETDINGSFQNGIKKLLTKNAISPTDPERAIPNLVFEDSVDSRITSLTLEAYYYGDNLYDVVTSACIDNNIGFQIRLSSDKKMVFGLYKGLDRTYDQEIRPYVVFSPEFDNILTSKYFESSKALKNCALVSNEVREQTTTSRYFITTEVKPDNYQSGLDRREMFLEASVSDTDENGNKLTTAEKKAQMQTAGSEELAETNITKAFDASVDPSRQFVYGVDFFIGDVVQVKNEYGYESKARVTELIRSDSTSGESVNPTFTVIENLD